MDITRFKSRGTILNSVNRKLAVGIWRGYRTIPTETEEVLAKLVPIRLLVEERTLAYGRTPQKRKAITGGRT